MKVDAVLAYFEEAPLAAAELALYIVTKAVSKRQPEPAKRKKRTLSSEARQRIADAQHKRWAGKKPKGKRSNSQAIPTDIPLAQQ